MPMTEPPGGDDPADPGQTREVFEVLADEMCWVVLRALLRRGPLTQAELVTELRVSRPAVSRALSRLRSDRLIASSGGRDASHEVVLRDALLDAVTAGDRLAEAVNARRVSGQRRATRQTGRDRLSSVDGQGQDDGSAADHRT